MLAKGLLSIVLLALTAPAWAQGYVINPATGMAEPAAPAIKQHTPSLGIYGPPGGDSGGGTNSAPSVGGQIAWSVFTDPTEHAFTMDVPSGWSVRGGVHRISAIQVPFSVRAVSPDSGIELFFGDPNLSMFLVPNAALDFAGYHEGAMAVQFGERLQVQRYRSGSEFAAEWGPTLIGARCAQPVVGSVQALPEASRSIDMAFAEAGSQAEVQVGEASFSCRLNGAPAIGYVFAATERVASGVADNAIWQVKLLSGFVAPAGQEGRAANYLSHAAASFRIDPNWQAAANQTSEAVSQIVTKADAVMAASIAQRFAYANRMGDVAHQGEVEAIRGVKTYYDLVSGRTFQLDNSAAHYWVGPGHPVPVPTPGSEPPFPGARELQLANRQQQ